MSLTPEQRTQRRRAYLAVRRALRTGELVRGTSCEACQPLHGHHRFGYEPDHALDVVWLCSMHHSREHTEMKDGLMVEGVRIQPRPSTDETWIQYYELVIAEAEQRIGDAKRQLPVLRNRVTREKNRAARLDQGREIA